MQREQNTKGMSRTPRASTDIMAPTGQGLQGKQSHHFYCGLCEVGLPFSLSVPLHTPNLIPGICHLTPDVLRQPPNWSPFTHSSPRQCHIHSLHHPLLKIYIPLLLRCERRPLSKVCRVPHSPALLTAPAHPHIHPLSPQPHHVHLLSFPSWKAPCLQHQPLCPPPLFTRLAFSPPPQPQSS